jgi:hypothetical protein
MDPVSVSQSCPCFRVVLTVAQLVDTPKLPHGVADDLKSRGAGRVRPERKL